MLAGSLVHPQGDLRSPSGSQLPSLTPFLSKFWEEKRQGIHPCAQPQQVLN